jgi:ABC-2 type transport system ATP-binding protein
VTTDASRLTLSVATDGKAAQVRYMLDDLDPGRDAIVSFTVRSATLDDVFLALTQYADKEAIGV